jgi:hypothetical protein
MSVENVVPLHVEIHRTGGRRFDLPFDAALQKYLQFPYNFFLVLVYHEYD